jgi:kynurenine 3-monooxygenase
VEKLGVRGLGGSETGSVAVVGGGPAGLVTAIALARRGIRTTVFEREPHPQLTARVDPDRAYTVDITDHGLRALRSIEATPYFDARMVRFKGIQQYGRVVDRWCQPGWTGSRGDVQRALLDLVRDHYAESVDLCFESAVSEVDVHTGTVTSERAEGSRTSRFDLVVGADGTRSVVRRALQDQVAGFVVRTTSIPTYVTMIELSRVGDRLDKHYLQALSVRHFNVAGAVNGGEESQGPRWFCCVGSKEALAWRSLDDARDYFRRVCPAILDLASDDDIAAFVQRPGYHVGRTASCSQLHAGRAVLLGDAAAEFPPIGQGVNAAMESAAVLGGSVGEAGGDLALAAARYDAAWKPEADAVSWIAQRLVLEEPLDMLRSGVTALPGSNAGSREAAAELPYSEVRRRAERLGPVWI